MSFVVNTCPRKSCEATLAGTKWVTEDLREDKFDSKDNLLDVYKC